MDNGTAEYAFVTTFFAPEPDLPPANTPQVSSHLFSPTALSVPLPADDAVSTPATDMVLTPRPRALTDRIFGNETQRPATRLSKDDYTVLNAIWKQIMDPALEHAKVGFSTFSPTILLLIPKTRVDICPSDIGARATCDTSPDDDPIHRGGHERDTETQLPTFGNLRFWSSTTDVAALPESNVRANRGTQKDRGRRWRRLFPPGYHDK